MFAAKAVAARMKAMKHDILNRIPEIKSENPELFAMRFESGLRGGNSDSKG